MAERCDNDRVIKRAGRVVSCPPAWDKGFRQKTNCAECPRVTNVFSRGVESDFLSPGENSARWAVFEITGRGN